LSEAAGAAGVSVRCAREWIGRYRVEGDAGLVDRSSAPGSIPHRTSDERVQVIAALRRLRFTGPEIAQCLGMALLTVSGILKRIGMGKLGRLGLEPAKRYERQRPGELIHIDVKKLEPAATGALSWRPPSASTESTPARANLCAENGRAATARRSPSPPIGEAHPSGPVISSTPGVTCGRSRSGWPRVSEPHTRKGLSSSSERA